MALDTFQVLNSHMRLEPTPHSAWQIGDVAIIEESSKAFKTLITPLSNTERAFFPVFSRTEQFLCVMKEDVGLARPLNELYDFHIFFQWMGFSKPLGLNLLSSQAFPLP